MMVAAAIYMQQTKKDETILLLFGVRVLNPKNKEEATVTAFLDVGSELFITKGCSNWVSKRRWKTW